ncbi:hypothetical protein HIM_05145 [Hirsutella minnesotensis 3608]|uniref:FAD-binding domain-containing protein n=1 Tax=Hirsutella minnesotensis 3608 TaxID=1043627 RepID=A0A0F8A5J7_9HYPO|nr:hypothetical protein HIM_05145 [Hirsutella minnesotensis 3608]
MRPRFHVIVVGGGPVGLTTAHALSLAGIDFTVLEQRSDIAPDSGASIILGPDSLRIMQQLGLLQQLEPIGFPLRRNTGVLVDGRIFKDSTGFEFMRDQCGTAPQIFHRAELVTILYQSLPDDAKFRVLRNKEVVSIESNEDGVSITCKDGSCYAGTIVIGTDGTHSRTRHMMRHLALKANPGASWDPEGPFMASYKCMWCSFPRVSESGRSYETQHKDRSITYISGRNRGWIFVYEKLPESVEERQRFTEKDLMQFATSVYDYSIAEDLTVKDVFEDRLTAGIANLEEGIAQNWSWGRIVLAGDACHKFTPNAGYGLNDGIQDIVVLVNKLRQLIVQHGISPTLPDLSSLFQEYHRERRQKIEEDASESAHTTRLQAWANPLYYFVSRYVLSVSLVEKVLAKLFISRGLKDSHILDFVPADEPYKGTMTWKHPLTG